jgi:hypothetical protein
MGSSERESFPIELDAYLLLRNNLKTKTPPIGMSLNASALNAPDVVVEDSPCTEASQWATEK